MCPGAEVNPYQTLRERGYVPLYDEDEGSMEKPVEQTSNGQRPYPAAVTVVDRQVPGGADRLLDLTQKLGHSVAGMTLVGYEFTTAEHATELIETLTIRWRP